MRNLLSLFVLILSVPVFFSCAPELTVMSCTSQEYYPGRQEEKPYQEIVIEVQGVDAPVQLDSLAYGKQIIPLKGANQRYYAKAEGTKYSNKAILYYSKKNKHYRLTIEPIEKLNPLSLP